MVKNPPANAGDIRDADLIDPWVGKIPWSPPGSSVQGIFKARILEWVAILFSRASRVPSIVSHFKTERETSLRSRSGQGPHLAKMLGPRGFSRVAAGFSSYDGEFRLPLGLALGSPIFPSSCEGKLGVALGSLQGPAGTTHSSTRGLRPPEQLERPAGFPGDLPDPGIEPVSPALAGGVFTT